MNDIGAMTMPEDFRYKEIFFRGRPQHDRYDLFSAKHPKMDSGRRAKIFSPFDALKGFNEAVLSKNVIYESMTEQESEEREELNRRLLILKDLTINGRIARMNSVRVTVTHYVVCNDKNNEAYGIRGLYRKTEGICLNVDTDITKTVLIDNERIAFENIYRIDNTDGLFDAGFPRYG